MKSLFPYQGGKKSISTKVWSSFGNDLKNYIEPFCGSAAVLFNRPDHINCIETINDIDGLLINAYRSIKYKPEEVVHYTDWPVSELCCEARHHYLCKLYAQTNFINNMRIDETSCDPKSAGYWIYGACMWMGQGWCSDKQINKYVNGNPDIIKDILNGKDYEHRDNFGRLPRMGRGINRGNFGKLPHLGNPGTGINREDFGRLPNLGDAGTGINRDDKKLINIMNDYCNRLRNVRIVCGDWQRVLTTSVTINNGLTGVFLDPPYSLSNTSWQDDYGYRGKENVFPDVIKWCKENEDNEKLVIALCGQEGDWHPDPKKWETIKWVRNRGYSKSDNKNRFLERIWICNSKKIRFENYNLFDEEEYNV